MPSARTALSFALVLAALSACGQPEPEPSCGIWYPDLDNDGFGDESAPVEVCPPDIPPASLITRGGDCNDRVRSIHRDADEICDGTGVDEDCDGLLDGEDDNLANGRWSWPDADGDGHGRAGSTGILGCTLLEGHAAYPTDCDDNDARTFPGAAPYDSTSACMTDADGDGFGSDTPMGTALAGTDCDDSAPERSPGAAEQLDDGIDQTCDGADAWFVREDFDGGTVDVTVVESIGLATLSQKHVFAGTHSLQLTDGATITLRELGTLSPDQGGACETLRWSFVQWRGGTPPAEGETLTVQLRLGAGFQDVYTIGGTGAQDAWWSRHEGLLTRSDAYRADFQLRLQASAMQPGASFYVDDLEVACTGADDDGDGFGAHVDCDPSDGAHWRDCGLCDDPDGDSFGLGCDLGNDCSPFDAAENPAATDTSIDGTDQNCDGIDGPAFFDDFEAADGLGWDTFPVEASYDARYVASGYRSLHLTGTTELERAEPLDTSACSEVGWSLLARRGPPAPSATDHLTLTWSDGTVVGTALDLPGDVVDAGFVRYRGVITDPDALTWSLALELSTAGASSGAFYVDDLGVGCDPQDHDRDGFWGGLEDCDDLDGSIHPGATDTVGDRVDKDCDGFDD